jgi:alpha-L-arabinofuranosidase
MTMIPSNIYWRLAFLSSLLLGGIAPTDAQTPVNVQVAVPGKAISPDLFGIFFEDINYSADGGLYGELIQNRSFEYSATEQPTWNELTGWELTQRGGAKGQWELEVTDPICANNPHYVILQTFQPGEGVGLVNNGFDGIAVKAGEQYDVSIFARQLYMNAGYGADSAIDGRFMPMVARLESTNGSVLGEVLLKVDGVNWEKISGTITATATDNTARFVLLMKAKGGIAVDDVSLFPHKTFHDRPNGLRPDLAQVVADLHPKFIRFPGGCVAHGRGLYNIYRWKDTIGPVEQRRGQRNFWHYHQSVGLGYFEYFQFCEDIGAKPLPVLAAGVCCPNADQKRGKGQQCIPLADMPAYIQDIFDLIELANGPATSKWGAKRAASGHPEPFHLEYLGIGNEDLISPEFKERFAMIQKAIQKKYPKITVIGTVGGHANDENFHTGWKFANELNIPMVDEHYYEPPQWFLDNLHRYDNYDRKASKVYVGEYASRGNAWSNALAEAAYMTTLERNGDVVRLASYAPLLANQKHTQWRPDMIYFDNTRIMRSANYYVQQMFMQNQGEVYLPTKVESAETNLMVSCVRDSKSGDAILKLVNVSTNSVPVKLNLAALGRIQPSATRIVLAGDPGLVNKFDQPDLIAPKTDSVAVAETWNGELPASSFTLIRLYTATQSALPK